MEESSILRKAKREETEFISYLSKPQVTYPAHDSIQVEESIGFQKANTNVSAMSLTQAN